MMLYIGIDNGVSGSVAILSGEGRSVQYFPTPTFSDLNYTKKAANISRVDICSLRQRLNLNFFGVKPEEVRCVLERPMIMPGRFKATISAVRALEATLICLGQIGLSVQYIDSREWQKAMLPSGIHGPELKHASAIVGCRLFPSLKQTIAEIGDADGLLIAEYARKVQR